MRNIQKEKVKMDFLKPFQKKAVEFHRGVLKNFKGTLLSGCEGCGKTRMSIALAADYENVLYVAPAKFLKTSMKERDRLIEDYGVGMNVEMVSYHAFADPKKKILPKDYDFIIFDECHFLKNYSAKWTQKFTRIKFTNKKMEQEAMRRKIPKDIKKKFILLSATPITRNMAEYAYSTRKTGAFGDMSSTDFYIKYFGARQSQYGDFLEKGEFQNKDDFVQHLNRVTYYLDPDDIDREIPLPKITTKYIEGTWEDRTSIVNETEMRLKNGLKKVDGSARYISSEVHNKNISTAIILCHFHEVAKALHDRLGYPLALDNKKLSAEVDRIKEKGGFLITTLGLTSGGYSINECDNLYLVESNYQWALDRQSIRRCLRMGKRTTLNVTYLQLEGEAPYLKATETAWVLEVGRPKKTGSISPSQVETLDTCPGSYWLPDTTETDFMTPYAEVGKARHSEAERILRSKEEVSDGLKEDIKNYIDLCRKYMNACEKHAIEDQVILTKFGPTIRGYVDFWCWDGKRLTVIDYKNGSSTVKVKGNFQLQMYAYMICEKYKLTPKNIDLIIVQKEKIKKVTEEPELLDLVHKRVKKVIDKVEKAKANPKEHLDPECTSAFCRAEAYHEKINGYKNRKGEVMPRKVEKKSKPKSPVFKVKGVVTLSINKETKKSPNKKRGKKTYLVHKLVVPVSDIPVDELKEIYAPRDLRSLQAAVKKPNEKDMEFGVTEDERIFWVNDWSPNASDLGDQEVEATIFAKFADEGRVFMSLEDYTVLNENAFGDDEEEEEASTQLVNNSNSEEDEDDDEEEEEALGF